MTDESTVTATPGPGETATAVVGPATTITKTVEHTEASALPEVNWGWRRGFIFSVSYVLLAITWRVVEISQDIVTQRMIARYALALIGLALMLYVAGASAEQITKLIQAAKTTRRETVTTEPKA